MRNDCGSRSLAVGLGVGLSFGLLLLLLLIILLLFLFVFKGKREEDPRVKKPNFQAIIFPPGYKKVYNTEGLSNALTLLKEALLKHLGLVNLFTPFISNKETLDQVPKALAYIFQGFYSSLLFLFSFSFFFFLFIFLFYFFLFIFFPFFLFSF